MAALNHAVMIPGLIVVVILFWAWMPIWGIIWCMRRASGKKLTDAELQAGHVPHKGFEPPQDFDYVPHLAPTQIGSAPLRKGIYSQLDNAAQMEWTGEKPGIMTDEAQRQKQEEKQAAAQKQLERREQRERQERHERREMEKDARRKEKGKERAHSVSEQSMDTYSAVTAPEDIVTRDSRRHHTDL